MKPYSLSVVQAHSQTVDQQSRCAGVKSTPAYWRDAVYLTKLLINEPLNQIAMMQLYTHSSFLRK